MCIEIYFLVNSMSAKTSNCHAFSCVWVLKCISEFWIPKIAFYIYSTSSHGTSLRGGEGVLDPKIPHSKKLNPQNPQHEKCPTDILLHFFKRNKFSEITNPQKTLDPPLDQLIPGEPSTPR